MTSRSPCVCASGPKPSMRTPGRDSRARLGQSLSCPKIGNTSPVDLVIVGPCTQPVGVSGRKSISRSMAVRRQLQIGPSNRKNGESSADGSRPGARSNWAGGAGPNGFCKAVVIHGLVMTGCCPFGDPKRCSPGRFRTDCGWHEQPPHLKSSLGRNLFGSPKLRWGFRSSASWNSSVCFSSAT